MATDSSHCMSQQKKSLRISAGHMMSKSVPWPGLHWGLCHHCQALAMLQAVSAELAAWITKFSNLKLMGNFEIPK